ncbi:pectate lyase [Streptosporangium sp. NPDC048047]|uniref:pectate lyase n=1 Tax=Streptosporangium sp. NPDC048047 TaxID=3155748 RepID=UPI00341502A6
MSTNSRLRACVTAGAAALLAAGAVVGLQLPASAAPASGSYALVNSASGLCLDVTGASTSDGAALTQSSCNGAASQTWQLSFASGGQKLVASHSGRCADIQDAGTSAGKLVLQQGCAGSAFQSWNLTASGSNYRVVNIGSTKCLNAEGSTVKQNSCDSAASKQWTLKAAGSGPGPTPTATPTTGPTTPPPSGSWPSPNGQQAVGSTINVSGSMDGGMKRYYGTGDLGSGGQSESQPPIFKLSDGATLQNVILGAPAADGIHCMGTCTLRNVWWEDVGEDAATFKGTSASQTMTIDGGGARSATDKVFQHNGPGTMYIKNFRVENFGKLYRSCGNCSKQYQRNVVISNVVATTPGKVLAGINTNYGDTARFSSIRIVNDSSHKVVICDKYKGVTSGEPSHIGSGADGVNCLYSSSDISYS